MRALFLVLILSGCASMEYAGLPPAQARALSDYRGGQEFCLRNIKRDLVVQNYIACMLDLGYIEPYPVPEEK